MRNYINKHKMELVILFIIVAIGTYLRISGILTNSFAFTYDGIKQSLVHMDSYRIEVDMILQSYGFPITIFFLSYESNRPLMFSNCKSEIDWCGLGAFALRAGADWMLEINY